MPRARTVSTEEEAVVVAPKKRAPRKRIPRVEASSLSDEIPAPKPRARRPRATPKVAEPVVEESEPVRRAPTPIQAERRATKRGNRALVAVGIFFVVVAGTGVAIGMSDNGQIDVVAVVNERNERVGRGEVREGEGTVTVPVQNTMTAPNGGMVPADPSLVPPPPPVETASTTATTTEETATSTESGESETDAPQETDGEQAVTPDTEV